MENMETFNNALLILIIVIFGLTAFLAIASIPDWIKISEWYKKKLFLALIIEIIALMLAYVSNILSDKNPKPEADRYNKEQVLDLLPSLEKKMFYVINNKDTLGKISIDDLTLPNLFNSIKYNSEGYELDNHRLIKWEYKKGKWSSSDNWISDCPYYIKISDDKRRTIYEIREKNEHDTVKPLYTSKESISDIDLFNRNNRKVHITEYVDKKDNQLYYSLFRIVDANLQSDSTKNSRYVYISQMKITPILNEKKLLGKD